MNKINKKVSPKVLEHNKKGSIAFIKEKNNLISWEYCIVDGWEGCLTSDYWKNWQKKINGFQSQKGLDFYVDRLGNIIEYIFEVAKKGSNNMLDLDTNKVIELVRQEEKRLENISEEEFNKTDKWRKSGSVWKELLVEEMKNDPWFSKQLGFGSENKEEKPVKKDNEGNTDYQTWTKDQLISEINCLKVEIESLKNNQTLTSSEKQEILQKNQQKLERLNSYYNDGSQSSLQSNNFNDKFPTSLILGGVVLLAIGGLLTVLIYKNKKSKK